MARMDAEQWATAEKRLQVVGLPVQLLCDGYKVTIARHRLSEMRDCLMIWVDGKFNGKWLLEDCEERRRFCCPRTMSALNRKVRAGLVILGKSTLRRLGIDPAKRVTYYSPIWGSLRKLKTHLIKNNKVIELVPDPVTVVSGLMAAALGMGDGE